MFNLFRLCGKDEISFFIVAKPATMSKQHSTLSKGRKFTINSFDIVAGVDRASYVRTVSGLLIAAAIAV